MVVGFPNLDYTFTISIFMPAHGDLSFAGLSDRELLDAFLRDSCPDLFAAVPFAAHQFFAGPPAPLVSSSCSPWQHNDWLCLIGDAAHTLVPFLGQGLNAGFEDCEIMMRLLDETGGDWPRAMRAFGEHRPVDCSAVVDLAERHFDELARAARDPRFVVRKALEERLHGLAPDVFAPLYTMVAFEGRPYREIRARRDRQEEILDRLMEHPAIDGSLDSPGLDAFLQAELASLVARETVAEAVR
jgi:kynurenine 3-monooxygenase